MNLTDVSPVENYDGDVENYDGDFPLAGIKQAATA